MTSPPPSSRDAVSTTPSAAPEGLRARRRRETAQAIHAAAVRLVERDGLAHVTVDMISAEAGISPRTFFNYFPTKESALSVGPPPLTDEQRLRIAEGDPRPRRVLEDLVDVLIHQLDEDSPPPGGRRHFRAMVRIATAHPELAAVLHARFDAFESELTGVVAHRLGVPAADPLPALLTGLALSVVRVGLQQWSTAEEEPAERDGTHGTPTRAERRDTGEPGDSSPAAELRHAAALLRTVLSDQPE
ncbi:TetR/AcrR family transcriptional regulator [Streptomyces sp. NPDC059894]|uniref:TetR/AcrR family transcriptional regulator n=1 Tax=unclassified Streptomyces TaxID=2593676 RepID=UPI003669BE07